MCVCVHAYCRLALPATRPGQSGARCWDGAALQYKTRRLADAAALGGERSRGQEVIWRSSRGETGKYSENLRGVQKKC